MSDLKAGDLVRLKSGGPVMVVESLNLNEEAECSWFTPSAYDSDKWGDNHCGLFKLAALVKEKE